MDANEKLQAYLHARHVHAFRRLLWARLGVGLLVWTVVAFAISLSRAALAVGVGVLAVPAIWAISYEWRATKEFYSHPMDNSSASCVVKDGSTARSHR
jgi:fatty acid desaturase